MNVFNFIVFHIRELNGHLNSHNKTNKCAYTQHNLDNKPIVFYTRYFDNILIIYEHKTTTHTQILNFTNSVHLLTYSLHGAESFLRS